MNTDEYKIVAVVFLFGMICDYKKRIKKSEVIFAVRLLLDFHLSRIWNSGW